MTLRKDRVGEPIDSLEPFFAATGNFWNNQDAWSNQTPAPVPGFISSAGHVGGLETASYTQNPFFEPTSDVGFNNALSDSFVQTSYTRDDGGRVTSMSRFFQGASGFGSVPTFTAASTYTYRPDGRVGRIVNPDGTHDFTYNSRGLVESQVVSG